KPIEVRFGSQRDDLAIYRRKNGVTWEELPSILIDGEIFTFSEKTGYFKLGPKTIIVPEETNIHQNYPNPFNPITTIMYDIGLMEGLSQNVSITIYNLLGQHVKTLIHDKDQVGQFTVQWNGQNEFGQPMSTGVYFVQLTTKTGIIKNKKMMLLK
ncbi:MAG: T9SS type A sorting domain-containing protein, partial [Candidatus Marinimicrobia bacterium]|nr:T9SS type A sorting domain-containing protein [Candidatus Neomarinimicrobiota bacterium]